jgi:pyruvate/2-oxoglutarate dehydrogenase complex dihydrolipoamide acyltransferase (E2) component
MACAGLHELLRQGRLRWRSRTCPRSTRTIEGDEIVYHDYVDMSVAVSAPNGLVVPVVRNVDQMALPRSKRRSAISASAPRTAR